MGVVMGALAPSGVPAWAASVAIFGEGRAAVYHKRKRALGKMPRGRKSEGRRTAGPIGGGPEPAPANGFGPYGVQSLCQPWDLIFRAQTQARTSPNFSQLQCQSCSGELTGSAPPRRHGALLRECPRGLDRLSSGRRAWWDRTATVATSRR